MKNLKIKLSLFYRWFFGLHVIKFLTCGLWLVIIIQTWFGKTLVDEGNFADGWLIITLIATYALCNAQLGYLLGKIKWVGWYATENQILNEEFLVIRTIRGESNAGPVLMAIAEFPKRTKRGERVRLILFENRELQEGRTYRITLKGDLEGLSLEPNPNAKLN